MTWGPEPAATPNHEVGDLMAVAELGSLLMLAHQVDDRLRLAAHAVAAHLSRPVAAGLRDGSDSFRGIVWHDVPQEQRGDVSRAMVRLAPQGASNEEDAGGVVRSSGEDIPMLAVNVGAVSIGVLDAPESAVPFLRAVGRVLASAVATGARWNVDLGMNLVWAAHELETPLMTVRMAMEQAMQTGHSGDWRRLLERGVRELELLSEVADSLLRSQAGGSQVERHHVDLGRLVPEMLATIADDEDGRRVRSVAAEPVWASVDPVQFRIAVMNLVRNALRHARQGSITVRVLREDDDAVVTVADEGRGVPEAVRDRIFEPFVTGHAETAEPRGGNGLGLFICKRIVERHDGTVTMEDQGGGSIFVVRLPWDDGGGDQRSAS